MGNCPIPDAEHSDQSLFSCILVIYSLLNCTTYDNREGSVAAETEPAQDNPNNATAANATAANATKLFRKRALFSQTANTLLEADIDPSTPPPSTIKELVEKKDTSKKNAVSESDDDDLFATPNRSATKIKPRQGEIEITRIDESPLDDGTEEIGKIIIQEDVAHVISAAMPLSG